MMVSAIKYNEHYGPAPILNTSRAQRGEFKPVWCQTSRIRRNILMLIPFKSALLPASVMLACGLLSSGCTLNASHPPPSAAQATLADDNPCSDKNGTAPGAADMARKKCALSAIAKKYALDISLTDVRMSGTPSNVLQTVGFAVAVRPQNVDASIPRAGDDLAPTERSYLTEIAKEYAAGQQTSGLSQDISLPLRADAVQSKGRRLLIVAHTDDIGDSRLNANFSERRAHAVARIFRDAGMADSKIYFQGAGEVLPVADNRLPEGRMKNRRIEIMDLSDGAVLRQYLAARNARLDFYRINGSSPAAVTGKSNENAAANLKSGGKKSIVANIRKTPQVFFDFGGTALSAAAGGPNIGQLYIAGSQPETAAKAAAPLPAVVPATTLVSDSPLAHSCRADRPRLSNGIKALRDGKEIATAEFMPGLFSTVWSAKVHEHVISLARVAVSRDDGAPVGKPQLQLYKNYGTGKKRADFVAAPDVNVYKGDKALLYRVFVNGPLRCMDIVIPNDNPATTGASTLYYDNGARPMMVNFNPLLIE